MNHVVLRGISEKYPHLCVIGWVEDMPHFEEGTAAFLNEPLFFVNTTSEASKQIELSFLMPEHQVPMTVEFFEYTKVEIYEGVTTLAAAYINMLLNARRDYHPMYFTKWSSIQSIYNQK